MARDLLLFEDGRPFPPESGPLTITHGRFYTDKGVVWDWRGASMFTLLERRMAGEDISPQIRWMVAQGVNVAREFVAGVPWPGHRWLYESGDWPAQLRAHAFELGDAGIRLEATVVTAEANDAARWAPVLERAYNALAGLPTVFLEWVNEPWVHGGMVFAAVPHVARHGILSALGAQPDIDPAWQVPMLDYGTCHLPRDMDHFPRNSKDLLEFRQSSGNPWVSDEPIGIAEYDKQGAGARTTDRSAVASHFGIARLFGAGATIHSQFGLEGRCPSPKEPISQGLAGTITQVWRFIPGEAQLGAYAAPHVGNFPVSCPGGACSTLGHAYASLCGDVAYLVVPKPAAGWVPAGVDGWRVSQQCDDLPIWRLRR